jgi:Bacterial regulatory helix-turn-helix protein, lysR family
MLMEDTDLLRSFVAVAESRAFPKPAKRLNSTQSTIGAQIHRLEDDAGLELVLIACVSTRTSVKDPLADVLVWPRDSPARHRSDRPTAHPLSPSEVFRFSWNGEGVLPLLR